jgi:sugar diacid utilization regulator
VVLRSSDSEYVREAAEAVLQVIDDAVATLAEGYATARREMVRREETMRRELIDDLLRGDADVGSLVARAEPFGLDLARPHLVALAAPGRRLPDAEAATTAIQRIVFDRFGDRNVLVAVKDGRLLVLAPASAAAPERTSRRHRAVDSLGRLMHGELSRLAHGQPWQVAEGRPYPGAYGIARSFEEAREALTMATRLHMDAPVIGAEELLIYRVLVRDQPAIVDLVQSVLGPLTQARGGVAPLLATLEAYFAAGSVSTETARRLSLSVRAVTYRMDRIRVLSGYDPADPTHRFALHAAVLGARLLGWPQQPLPPSPT